MCFPRRQRGIGAGESAIAAAGERHRALGVTGAETLAPKWKAEAVARASDLAPVVRALRGMAAELTRRKIATPRGGRWSAQTVKMVVGRLAS